MGQELYNRVAYVIQQNNDLGHDCGTCASAVINEVVNFILGQKPCDAPTQTLATELRRAGEQARRDFEENARALTEEHALGLRRLAAELAADFKEGTTR